MIAPASLSRDRKQEDSHRTESFHTDHFNPAELDLIWNEEDWKEPCLQFSKVTGLTLSIYDSQAKRRLGPLLHGPLATLLREADFWTSHSVGYELESELVQQCLNDGGPHRCLFEESLIVYAIPVKYGENIAGVLTTGWIFTKFADPVACEKMAQKVKVPGYKFWLVAREQLPVSEDRFSVFADLLKTLAGSILKQKTYVESLRRSSQAKDEFLATISHELKTPLTSIMLSAQTLRRYSTASLDQKLIRGLDTIVNAAISQNKIVDDLLEASRIITGKMRLQMEVTGLNDIIRAASESVQAAASVKKMNLRISIPKRPVCVLGDPLRLQQVLWNLLSNAIKFTPEGGSIVLNTKETPDSIRILVKDSGKGIEKTFLPHVFDRFSQADLTKNNSNTGMGLGLSIAKYVVDFHGGSIEAASEGEDKGATFTVTLPKHLLEGEK